MSEFHAEGPYVAAREGFENATLPMSHHAPQIIIVISEFLERHAKTKRIRAPAYSRALQRIKGVVQRVVHGKLRSYFQRRQGRYVLEAVDSFHPKNSPKPHFHPTNSSRPLARLSAAFHSKLETLLFNKSYPNSSSSSNLPRCLNSKHHPLYIVFCLTL